MLSRSGCQDSTAFGVTGFSLALAEPLKVGPKKGPVPPNDPVNARCETRRPTVALNASVILNPTSPNPATCVSTTRLTGLMLMKPFGHDTFSGGGHENGGK